MTKNPSSNFPGTDATGRAIKFLTGSRYLLAVMAIAGALGARDLVRLMVG